MSAGNTVDYCKKVNGLNASNIIQRILNEIGRFDFNNFYSLLSGIRKGDEDCYKIGLILSKHEARFGSNAGSVYQSYADLIDNKTTRFIKLYKKYPIPDKLLIKVISIPGWKFTQTKTSEVLRDIRHRRNIIGSITDNGDIKSALFANYEDARRKIENYSKYKREVFHETGLRLVYLGSRNHLISSNDFSLKNLTDGDVNTRWCMPNKERQKSDTLMVSFDFNSLKEGKLNCKKKAGSEKYSECFVNTVAANVVNYEDGVAAQKKVSGLVRFKDNKNKYFKQDGSIVWDDKHNKTTILFELKKWIKMKHVPIRITFDFNQSGRKIYKNTCLSELTIDIK